jgi:hypothetical protein
MIVTSRFPPTVLRYRPVQPLLSRASRPLPRTGAESARTAHLLSPNSLFLNLGSHPAPPFAHPLRPFRQLSSVRLSLVLPASSYAHAPANDHHNYDDGQILRACHPTARNRLRGGNRSAPLIWSNPVF